MGNVIDVCGALDDVVVKIFDCIYDNNMDRIDSVVIKYENSHVTGKLVACDKSGKLQYITTYCAFNKAKIYS